MQDQQGNPEGIVREFVALMLVGFLAGPQSAAANSHTIASAFVDHSGRIEAGRAVDDDQVDLTSALGFTVDETTSVVTHDYRNGFKTTYNAPESVYCYYDAGHGRLDDRRVEKWRVKELHRRMARSESITADLTKSVDPLKHNQGVPSYVERPYSWIVLFSAEGQQRAGMLLHSDGELPRDPRERTFVETTVFHHVIAQPVNKKIDRLRLVHEVVQKYRHYEFFGVDVQDELAAVRLAEE